MDGPGGAAATAAHVPVLDLDARPQPVGAWVRSVLDHRRVLAVLARTDFQVRYKRASFGIVWSVALPLVQAVVLVYVFSRFTRFSDVTAYPVFVLSGIMAWSYLTSTVASSTVAIVDAATLTDKVWFPRGLLALVPPLANVLSLVVSMIVLAGLLPLYDVAVTPRLLLLPIAVLASLVFCSALGLVLAALNVYFRDVKFLVQAGLLAWFWLTPIAYPKEFAGNITRWLDLNPATGLVTLYRMGTIGAEDWRPSVIVSTVATILLLTAAVEIHRRRDRLFVDLL